MVNVLSEVAKVWIQVFMDRYEETNDPWYIKRVMWLRKYGDLKEVVTHDSKD